TDFLDNPSTGWLIPDGTIPIDTPTVYGTSGNDTFVSMGIDATIDGEGGHDAIVYRGGSGDYSITENADGSLTIADSVAGRDGTEIAIGIQYLEFNDKTVYAETSANADIARLYVSAFDRLPDQSGLNYWEDTYAAQAPTVGATAELAAVAAAFVGSSEFQTRYGSLSDAAFVTQLYNNTLDRAPDSGGFNYWVGQLQSGGMTEAQILVGFAESTENIANTAYSHAHQAGWLFQL
ncbi:MAG TPA: DUF4214 domain-containing protein, partial [Tepidisphaeraceae bacterium]|nr:DUF4214 domain-containing protein [Tepidisphaeraceae bacterium]